MSDKPKHRFWQIHLSTAIIMLLLAGLLLHANLPLVTFGKEIISRDGLYSTYPYFASGWPFQNQGVETQMHGVANNGFDFHWKLINSGYLAANVAIGVGLMVMAALAIESHHRRMRRKRASRE